MGPAISTPTMTANAQPAVITIQPEFWALDLDQEHAGHDTVSEEDQRSRPEDLGQELLDHVPLLPNVPTAWCRRLLDALPPARGGSRAKEKVRASARLP